MLNSLLTLIVRTVTIILTVAFNLIVVVFNLSGEFFSKAAKETPGLIASLKETAQSEAKKAPTHAKSFEDKVRARFNLDDSLAVPKDTEVIVASVSKPVA